jgi:hypothetical protein
MPICFIYLLAFYFCTLILMLYCDAILPKITSHKISTIGFMGSIPFNALDFFGRVLGKISITLDTMFQIDWILVQVVRWVVMVYLWKCICEAIY